MSDEARAASRAGWERAADGWGKWRAQQQDAGAPISAWMVDAIAPQPGHVVLEVAAGAGDTGFLAAELIHPGGRLICTDGAEKMLDVARARAAELDVQNVEFAAMEAEWLDMGTASVDAILCRFGYMLLVDPEAGVRDARRVLRPGGRLAVAVWDVPGANPLMTIGRQALAAVDAAPAVDPDAPGPFALSADGDLRELLESCGFVDVVVEPIDIVNRLASKDEFFEMQRAMSPTLGSILPTLSPADHARVRDVIDELLEPFVVAGGAVELPGRALGAAADA